MIKIYDLFRVKLSSLTEGSRINIPALSFFASVGISLSFFLNLAHAQTSNVEREARIKAATIYYIAKFVTWPDEVIATRPSKLSICTIGSSALERFLPETIKGKEVAGRQLEAHTIESEQDNLKSCDVVYFGDESEGFLKKLPELEQMHIVTISSERLGDIHPVVYLFNEQNKLRMEINLQSARRIGVQFSSELLQVSKIVP